MDVATWLRDLGLERHEAAFRDNLIEMDVVRDLTENDLEKLGLPLGDRKRVLKALAGLSPLAAAALGPVGGPRMRDEAERRPIWSIRRGSRPRLTRRTGAIWLAPISTTPPKR